MKVTMFKARALLREFPWLAEVTGEAPALPALMELPAVAAEPRLCRWVRQGRQVEVVVRRADKALLDTVPSLKTWDGAAGDFSRGTSFHAVLRDGSVVRDFVRKDEEHGSNWAHTPTTRRDGETVAEALDRVGASLVAFVVEDYHHSNSFPTGWVGERHSITIHKLPKSGSLAELVAAVADEATKEVDFETAKLRA